MTMTAKLVNAGNRSSDRIKVAKVAEDGTVELVHVLGRGSVQDIHKIMGHSQEDAPTIKIWCEHEATDQWCGQVQVIAVPAVER